MYNRTFGGLVLKTNCYAKYIFVIKLIPKQYIFQCTYSLVVFGKSVKKTLDL